MKTNIAIGLAVIAIIIGVIFHGGTTTEVVQTPVGANPGSLFDGQCITVGASRKCVVSRAFMVATTTPCDFISPNATSTLLNVSVATAIASGTAIRYDIATSTLPNATTTILYTFNQASGVALGFSFQGSTSASNVVDKQILAPNTHIVVGLFGVGGTPGGFDPLKLTGRCSIELNTI